MASQACNLSRQSPTLVSCSIAAHCSSVQPCRLRRDKTNFLNKEIFDGEETAGNTLERGEEIITKSRDPRLVRKPGLTYISHTARAKSSIICEARHIFEHLEAESWKTSFIPRMKLAISICCTRSEAAWLQLILSTKSWDESSTW